VVFIPCVNEPGDALAILGKAPADRGVKGMAGISLDQKAAGRPDAGGEQLPRLNHRIQKTKNHNPLF